MKKHSMLDFHRYVFSEAYGYPGPIPMIGFHFILFIMGLLSCMFSWLGSGSDDFGVLFASRVGAMFFLFIYLQFQAQLFFIITGSRNYFFPLDSYSRRLS